jgi:hypothetical protein
LERWLGAALEHVPRWIEHQMRLTEQPGCALAVASKGKVVLEAAYGHANLVRCVPLTSRHRFRVASHSKTFTAAGVLKLCDERIEGCSAYCPVLLDCCNGVGRPVMDNAAVPSLHQSAHHVRSHAPQPNHPQLHRHLLAA